MLYNPNTWNKFPSTHVFHIAETGPDSCFSSCSCMRIIFFTCLPHINPVFVKHRSYSMSFFKTAKRGLGFFFSWFWSFNWTVNILAVLPLLTFDSSLCVFQGWMSVWSTTAAALMCAWTNQSALTASVLLAISSWTERLVAVNKDADGLGK